MDKANFASGDNMTVLESSTDVTVNSLSIDQNIAKGISTEAKEINPERKSSEITVKTINDKEIHLKERIDQCKNIIESLKLELDEEKLKLAKELSGNNSQQNKSSSNVCSNREYISENLEKALFSSNDFAAKVDSKLSCDENLLEYEKQLQIYQNTLNMAQSEKRNAIRKQMLTKAYKLKLLEVENQCNVELLRIKQSLQCLEPLKMIVEKWKTTSNDKEYDFNNFELIPRYPELSPNTDSDVSSNLNCDNI